MEEELKQLKTVFRSLVVSSPSQVDVRSLVRDYRDIMGQQIPLAKFGCKDPVSFLKKYFLDCFLIQGPESNPILTLIVPETLKHIDQFVQRQKPSQHAKIKGKRRSVNETVLKQSTAARNLVTKTFEIQKASEKEIPPPQCHTSSRLQQKTERQSDPRLENKKESTGNTNLVHKNHGTREHLKYKTQSKTYTDTHRSESLKTNAPVNKNVEDEKDRNYVTSKSSDKENCSNEHSTAYQNFIKKRMPFLKRIDTERRECWDTEDSYSGRLLSSSTSSSKKAQLEELQRELSEMILEEVNGVLSTELLSKYRQRYGRELEFSRFGYTSVLSLACTLPGCTAHKLLDDWLLLDSRAPLPCVRAPPSRPPRVRTPTDPDDALPYIDYEPSVFPPDCMHFMDSIPCADLDGIEAGDMLEVMIGEVYSPSHFWMLRLGQEYNIAMEDLMDEMNAYFKSEGRERYLAAGAVRAGHYCSSCYHGDWHRSLIVKVLDSDTVKVRHVDYGTVETVETRGLRPLLRAWAALPAQAVRARLAAVAPPAAARRWPHASAARFLTSVLDRKLVASVVARDHQEDILEVVLIDTSTEEDIVIGELLVRAGHADARDHPVTRSGAAYLFPLFSALETGDTPNYAEIQAYLQDGIALDYVEDYRRHVPAAAPPRAPPTALVCPRPADVVAAPTPPCSQPASAPPTEFPPAPPPAVTLLPASETAAIEQVTLSASDCEVFTLLSQVNAGAAQRFMMEAIQRARRTRAPTPLNPLAAEFNAVSPANIAPATPSTPAPLATPPAPGTPSTPAPLATPLAPATPVTPAPPTPVTHAPPTPPASATPAPPPEPAAPPTPAPPAAPSDPVATGPQFPVAAPSRFPAPPYPPSHMYSPRPVGPRYPVPPVVFGQGPQYPPGWVSSLRYGPPTYMTPFGPMQPPPGYERFY